MAQIHTNLAIMYFLLMTNESLSIHVYFFFQYLMLAFSQV